MFNVEIKNWTGGWQNRVEEESIPDSAASNELNILTLGDHFEVRRGMALLGATENEGSGQITGLHVARNPNGNDQAYRTRGRKWEYYNRTTEDWAEIGTNAIDSDDDGDEVEMTNYDSLAGAQVYLGAPNTGLYKSMVANPADYSDVYRTGFNYHGYVKAKESRLWQWFTINDNNVRDRTQIFGSRQDKDELSDYTAVTGENIGTGNGSTKTFADTLAFKAAGARRTCFGVTATDGTETFYDNKDGTLTGSLGGTGTINYTTGAISVTFNTAPTNLQAITSNHYWEDSASGGVADFSYSVPRTAGQGFFFPQSDGGDFQNLFSINDTQYCIHRYKTWALNLTRDDTAATNLPYRNRVGIPNRRAAVETADGIYYVDDTDQNDPKFRLMTFAEGSTEVIPLDVSQVLDLSDFRFNKAVTYEWEDFILWACRTSDNDENNRVITYNKRWKVFDIHDYWVSQFATYNGTLIAGDSISNNVYTLFSGLDDDDSVIAFNWEGKLHDFAIPDRLKRMYSIEVEGKIGADQIVNVYVSSDRGGWTYIGQIRGDGSYVDRTQAVTIGSMTLGEGEMGGGSDGIVAYNYFRSFTFESDSFNLENFLRAKIRFTEGVDPDDPTTEGIGYFSVSLQRFKDIRAGFHRLPSKYV